MRLWPTDSPHKGDSNVESIPHDAIMAFQNLGASYMFSRNVYGMVVFVQTSMHNTKTVYRLPYPPPHIKFAHSSTLKLRLNVPGFDILLDNSYACFTSCFNQTLWGIKMVPPLNTQVF